MSAFMVDKEHIDLLVDVAYTGPRGVVVQPGSWYAPYVGTGPERHSFTREDQTPVGQMLVTENLHSIAARYPDTLETGELPGPMEQYYELPYVYRQPRYRLTAVEALKAIDCYEYQACEHEAWMGSEAREFCQRLRRALIGSLDGYDRAPWSWSAEHIAERMATV